MAGADVRGAPLPTDSDTSTLQPPAASWRRHPAPRIGNRRRWPPWLTWIAVLAALLLVGAAAMTPAAGGGRVFVGSFQATPEEFTGHLFAFPAAGCGKATCRPLRAYDVGPHGSTTTPALVGDTLLASTQETPDPNTSGVVAAFPANGCGAALCEPLWTGVNFADGFESSPVVAGKVVFVGKGPASGFPVDAGVYAFDVRGCGKPICQPRGFTQLGPEQAYQGASIAVTGGKVMLNSTDNTGAPDIPARSNLYVLTLPGVDNPT